MRHINACSFAVLLLAQITLLLSISHAMNNKAPFDISADFLEYQEDEQHLVAEGHVTVIQGSATLTADQLDYYREQNEITARGNAILKEKGSMLIGDEIQYSLKDEKGYAIGGKGYQTGWRFQGESWDKKQGYLFGRNASFTSCDLLDPHYHLQSSRVHLVPDQYFWSWNNIGYVDTIPVFYSPFMYKSLGKRRVVVQFQPGHDDVNGNFIKTTTTLRLTDNVYDKVYFDHFTEQGNGMGDELDYSNADKLKGSFFGYYINPKGNAALIGAPTAPQYNIREYHWQRLNPQDTLQANINLQQNDSFNNQYFPQDTNQANNNITSSFAFTHQTKQWNQRVVMERYDAPDADQVGQTFAPMNMQTASLPRYEFTMFQKPLWTPGGSSVGSSSGTYNVPSMTGGSPSQVLSSSGTVISSSAAFVNPMIISSNKWGPVTIAANGNAGEIYTRADEKVHSIASSQLTFSESIPLSRSFSFTPSVGPQLSWQDTGAALPISAVGAGVSTSTLRGLAPRFGTSDVLRWKISPSLSLDNTYAYTERFDSSFHPDYSLGDHGVDQNHLSWLAFYRPSRTILIRSFSGTDFRRIDNEDPNTYLQRKFDPWTNEITWDPTKKSEIFARYQAGFYPTRDNLWETSYQFHGLYKTILETGFLYNTSQSGLMTWNNHIAIYMTPSWRVDATVHSFVPTAGNVLNGMAVNDEEIAVIRDMHCWTAKFVYNNIPPYSREYSIVFDLKVGSTTPSKEIENRDLESQFYPWRAGEYSR
jgi:lipopolysaccharide export system protein LptA